MRGLHFVIESGCCKSCRRRRNRVPKLQLKSRDKLDY